MFSGKFSDINGSIKGLLQQARQEGNMQQEIQILNAMKNGFKPSSSLKGSTKTMAAFFRLNDRKLEALIKATTDDMQKAETAILRMANDQYRKIIFNAQAYANTGAGTYEKAVDMATKDFLSRGLNCVEYANGARHTLADYADMALRTAGKRAYLTREGEKRKEWGISTVIMNKRGNPCPKCLPYVGKVMIDDVWSGGQTEGAAYPLMSHAIRRGLYHPRCRDSHTTYFPGISTADDTWTKEELDAIGEYNKQDAKQQYATRQANKFGRLANYSLDEENRKEYTIKSKEWKNRKLPLTLSEEGAVKRYISPDAYLLNDKLRRGEVLTEFEKKWIMYLDGALDKLPNYEGNLNRTLTFKYADEVEKFVGSLNIGKETRFPQYLSTKKSGIYNPEGQVQIFIQNSKKGKDLGQWNSMENEVLYPINFPFKVINKVKKDNVYYILLEEL